MTTDTSSLEIFKKGVAQLFSTLTDDVDDETIIDAARFALQAVGEDEMKLEALVCTMYALPAAHITCSAKLLIGLVENATDKFARMVTTKSGETFMSGMQLVKRFILSVVQHEFTTAIKCIVWPVRSIDIMVVLYQTRIPVLFAGNIIKDMLHQMAVSEHLFVLPNFELFIRTCIACGPKLAETTKFDYIAGPLSEVAARASSESLTSRLAIFGLIQVRDSGWKIEMDVSPRVLTPTKSESVVGSEANI